MYKLFFIQTTVLSILLCIFPRCISIGYDISTVCRHRTEQYNPHEFDCRLFYYCNGNPWPYDIKLCSYDTYFSINHQSCKSEFPEGCQTPWSKELEIAIIDPKANSQVETSMQVVTSRAFWNSSETCFGIQNKTVFKAANGDCRSYEICLFGQSHLGQCPIGFSYNEQLNRCDTQNNGLCADAEMCPPSGFAVFEKIGSCSEYYECVNGTRGLKECANGLQFDAKQNRCAQPSVARCFECPVVDDVEAPVTYSGDTPDKYRMCISGRTIDLECASGLHWNQDSKMCELNSKPQISKYNRM